MYNFTFQGSGVLLESKTITNMKDPANSRRYAKLAGLGIVLDAAVTDHSIVLPPNGTNVTFDGIIGIRYDGKTEFRLRTIKESK